VRGSLAVLDLHRCWKGVPARCDGLRAGSPSPRVDMPRHVLTDTTVHAAFRIELRWSVTLNFKKNKMGPSKIKGHAAADLAASPFWTQRLIMPLRRFGRRLLLSLLLVLVSLTTLCREASPVILASRSDASCIWQVCAAGQVQPSQQGACSPYDERFCPKDTGSCARAYQRVLQFGDCLTGPLTMHCVGRRLLSDSATDTQGTERISLQLVEPLNDTGNATALCHEPKPEHVECELGPLVTSKDWRTPNWRLLWVVVDNPQLFADPPAPIPLRPNTLGLNCRLV